MEIKDVCNKVNRCIINQLGEFVEGDIKPHSHLKDDFGMDSLDDVELVMLLEEEFDIQISDEEAEKCLSVKDIYIGVSGKLGINVSPNYFNQLKPYESTEKAAISVPSYKEYTKITPEDIQGLRDTTQNDIFKRMLSIAKENNLFIQFDGFTQDENDVIVVTHNVSDTDYVVKDEEDFNKLVESLNVLNKFERK